VVTTVQLDLERFRRERVAQVGCPRGSWVGSTETDVGSDGAVLALALAPAISGSGVHVSMGAGEGTVLM
jgi:hypothetical protein